MMLSDIHHNALAGQGNSTIEEHSVSTNIQSVSSGMLTIPLDSSQVSYLMNHGPKILCLYSIPPGELPPPPPRACFGRDELVERVVGLAESFTPIALIGAGGIGKTSIALTVLHNNHIKSKFGNDRRFIRCDQFPTSNTHFLRHLSMVIGAGVENPEDLAPLRPFLSSKKMFIILDNAESILDPQGTDAQEIYATVEELSQFDNICLCITSRISTIPPDCETLVIPTLSVEAAHDTFHRIYKNGKQSNLINDILEQLDFHPLSITLLATVAHHNMWDTDQLAREWDQHNTGVLQTEHNKSLAATIELSLSSPMFQKLGPDARDLLGVVAFFPQGIDKKNLDWLFPTISNRTKIFDKFSILSLTYQNNGFVMMLAPLRDHLCPKDPNTSPLLCITKDCYFHRLSVDVNPNTTGFEEAQWITSEDVNVEHLVDIFTTTDATSKEVWDVCGHFVQHLYWHKPRLVVLGPKIKALPDSHPAKHWCLFQFSELMGSLGNQTERKQFLIHALRLQRERGDISLAAHTLMSLSSTNAALHLYEEGISQAKETLEIYKDVNDDFGQAHSLQWLGWLFYLDNQLTAAEETVTQAISLLSDKSKGTLGQCYRVLGSICASKDETEKAINHFQMALEIASSLEWHNEQFWIYYTMAEMFLYRGRFNEAHVHIAYARPHTVNGMYLHGRMMHLQARLLHQQHRPKEAKSEALCAAGIYEKLGAADDLETCRKLLQQIEEGMDGLVTSQG